ncbi:MAG: hypothetical protein ACJAQ6_001275 [Arenicella sp.]|jgi:hypothetical protein
MKSLISRLSKINELISKFSYLYKYKNSYSLFYKAKKLLVVFYYTLHRTLALGEKTTSSNFIEKSAEHLPS